MRITKAFLYTALIVIIWVIIQIIILLPVKIIFGKLDNLTHLYGILRITSSISTFLIFYYFFWKPKFKIKDILKNQKISPKNYIYLILIALGLFQINKPFWDFIQITDYYQCLENQEYTKKFNINSRFIYEIISTIIVAPIIEELFFRKFLLGKLVKTNNNKVSLIASSIFFSIIHIETYNNLIPAFIGGYILGFLYLKTNKISYSIFLHSILNTVVIITNNNKCLYNGSVFGKKIDEIYWIFFGIGILVTLFSVKKINKENY